MSTTYPIQFCDRNYVIHDMEDGLFNSSEAAVKFLQKHPEKVPSWAQTILVTERIEREIFRFPNDAGEAGQPAKKGEE